MSRTLLAALCLSVAGLAQQPTPATAPKEPEYVTTRDFKSKVFLIQHGDPDQLRHILMPLGSGHKGATLSSSSDNGLKTISVRDFPENLAAMEEALKRLDQPASATQASEVEFHIHVLFAHKTEGPSEGFPEEMKEVLKGLRSTLTYRSFTPIATFVQRAKAGSMNLGGTGNVELALPGSKGEKGPQTISLNWGVGALGMEGQATGTPVFQFSRFSLICAAKEQARVNSHLTVREGEKVVVGTSVFGDKGLIVVLTARRLK